MDETDIAHSFLNAFGTFVARLQIRLHVGDELTNLK
jgi:hypothetical protein